MNEVHIERSAILSHLEKVLGSETFQNGGRSGMLLRFVVERTLNGQGEQLKEYTLGAEALGRGDEFDPRMDSIARVEASRLRSRLKLYYATDGQGDALRIVMPRGSYQPQFEEAPREKADFSWLWKVVAILAVTVAGIAMWAPWRAPQTGLGQVSRLEVDLGPRASLRSSQVGSSSIIISPDGSRLAFVSFRDDGVPRLMTRRLNQTGAAETMEIAGTEGVRGPFFSPNGEWIAFLSGGTLKKVQVEGGAPVTLCDAAELLGGSWGDDGTIIASFTTTGLWRVPSTGGREPLIGFPVGTTARWPQVLPGSKAVLFAEGSPTTEGLSIYSLADHKIKRIVNGGTYGRYLASGHLAFVDQGTLFIAPFDISRLEVTGQRVAILNDVAFAQGFESADFDVSRSGSLVYRRDASQGRSVVQWLEASGKATALLAEPGVYGWPRLSPDGTKLVLTRGGAERVLQTHEWQTGRTTQLSDGKSFAGSAVWTPDSRLLVTVGARGGIEWLKADGAGGTQTLLAPGNYIQIPWSFNRTGDRLAFYQRGAGGVGSVTFDLWTVPVQRNGDTLSAGKPEPFLVSDAFETYPMFSPDGRWIAYTSSESGTYEIYVRAFPDNGRKWLVSNEGGSDPRWSGSRLFYRSKGGLQHVMVVDFAMPGGTFQPTQPRLWSKTPLADTGVLPNFDVSSDGRVVALLPAPQTGDPQDDRHVTIVINFLDEVRRRVPASK